MPWVNGITNSGNDDNFAPLRSLNWQLHVYGDDAPQSRALSTQWNLPIHVFPWNDEMKRKGLERDALYLLRPDGYIAVAANRNRSEVVGTYLAEMGFSLL